MKARLLPLLLFFLIAVAPSQAAAATHPWLGVAATGISATIPFDDACGVAVDEAGTSYVSDFHNRKVAAFGADGSFLFSIASARAESSPCDLAVDSASHLYGNYLHQGVVELFAGTTIDPERSTGIAVDPTGNRLYVAHRTHVSVYEPGGAPVPLTIGTGSLVDAYGVAVSDFPATAGYVYVGDASDDTVKVFDPAGDPTTPVEVIDGAGTPGGDFKDLTDTDLAIDQSDGHLFVVDDLQPGFVHPAAAVYELDAGGFYVSQISHWIEEVQRPPLPPKFFNRTLVQAQPSGLAVGAGGKIYVTSGNQEGSVLYAFGPSLLGTVPLGVKKAGTGEGAVASQLSGTSPPSSPFTGIECGPICAGEYELPPPGGPALVLTATPALHSRFIGWSGACSGTGLCKPTLSGALEVTATFAAIPQRTLAVSRDGAGEGFLTSVPFGLDCGSICSAGFDQGALVTLTPEASPGSEFAGWSGACSGTGACQVAMSEDRRVSATFEPVVPPVAADPAKAPRRLAIAVGGSGFGTVTSQPAGIECGTPCSGIYAPGSVVTLIASPDPESHFSGWRGCDGVAGNRCTVTLASSRTVSVSFDEGAALVFGALALKGAKGTLAVTVPGPGTLAASAKNLAPSKASAPRAGTVKLHLALSAAGRKALGRSKKGRLGLHVSITFTPSGGGAPVTSTKTVVFKKGSKK